MGVEIIPVIIIDYFSAERTKKFINDFMAYRSQYELKFFIVDNSCNKENLQELSGDYTKFVHSGFENFNVLVNNDESVYIIAPNENLGFARGNNLGFKMANSLYQIKYALFTNNDILFDEKFNLNRLFTAFKCNDSIGVVGPRVIGLDGIPQSPCKEMTIFDRWWKLLIFWPVVKLIGKLGDKFLGTTSDLIYPNEDLMVYRIIGAFMVVDVQKFVDVGMFDEQTFLYAEELILSEKLLKNGYSTYYVNEVSIMHEGGYTTGKSMTPINKLKKRFESELYYYIKYKNVSPLIINLTKVLFSWYSQKVRFINWLRPKK
ncbi:hypothetical protein ACTQ5F_08195 [Jeotgalibaca porci]|uniref:hypothetical protein n=1 Tax=Jeotgalibaca porci TaxID=1868793 RepID=UPI003F90B684